MSSDYQYGHMVHEYYVKRLGEVSRRRTELRKNIRSRRDVMKLRDEVQRKLKRCFGRFPKRTPLNVQITGKIERKKYTIEKLILDSRPNYPVTANLYVPKGLARPAPAVLGACGHAENAKAYPQYQPFARNLARQGYVVLIFDPIAQGERLQFTKRDGKDQPAWGTRSHNVIGSQLWLAGQNMANWFAWDAMRSLDYLLSRSEVDPAHVGMTGNSGGGTQTGYMWALDERITMAAPNCWVTQYRYNLENEEPTDAEQVIPGILAEGLDITDFFVARVPDPILLLGKSNDFFDLRGLRATYEELRRLYVICGAEQNVQMFIGEGPHGYSQDDREAMYRFFNKHANNRARAREPKNDRNETERTLQATPDGQVFNMGVRRAFDITSAQACELSAKRKKLSDRELVQKIQRKLVLPKRSGPPHYRILRTEGCEDKIRKFHSAFAVESDERIQTILHWFSPERLWHFPKSTEAVLYIPHRNSLQEILDGLAPKDSTLFAMDVRGMGRTTGMAGNREKSDFFHVYGNDYMNAAHGMMLSEPYAGRRVHDLLCALDLLADNGCRRVHLVGRGLGAVTATLAACLHPLVKQVSLTNCLLSYHELTQTPTPRWPQSTQIFNVLKDFDLPDCLRYLARRKKLSITTPWNAQMRSWPAKSLKKHLKELDLEKINVWA